jgi:glycosyltransferase involved in cell wall biosynthesis
MPFTIIIPVFNEEAIIEANTKNLVKFLGTLHDRYEIIIVDNGSNDSTMKKGKSLEKQFRNVRFFSIKKKGAVGWAFREAVLHARYDKLISVDMDLSVDLSFIKKCISLLDDNSIVIGSKKIGRQKRPFMRVFASGIFIRMVRMLLGMNFSDYSMAAKGYRKSDIINHVKNIDKGSSYVIELIYYARMEGRQMKEIAVNCCDTRKTKFNFIDEILYRFRKLLIFWLRNAL